MPDALEIVDPSPPRETPRGTLVEGYTPWGTPTAIFTPNSPTEEGEKS
jgi:hypothetical protein